VTHIANSHGEDSIARFALEQPGKRLFHVTKFVSLLASALPWERKKLSKKNYRR
jgi:hypothetical protein